MYPRINKRKRVSTACNTCRKQKIRCDGIRPCCGTCERRRDHCIYDDDTPVNQRSGTEGLQEPHTNPNSALKQSSQFTPNSHSGPSPSISIADTARDGDATPNVTAMGLVSGPLDSDYNSTEFFGDSSAITFIKQLQDTVNSHVNDLPQNGTLRHGFPQKPDSHVASKSAGIQSLAQQLSGLLPPRPLADHLVDCYFSNVHSLYPFVHKHAFLSLYSSLWAPPNTVPHSIGSHGFGLGDAETNHRTFYYGLNIIFALGCHFSATLQTERETTSEAFFRLCKPALEMEYLESADFALCQTLLLMAQYLQSSRTPNRCWHVISTACRVGQALGLHCNVGNGTRSFAEIQMRRRVWHGCVMLDLAVSTILGRPAMISQEPVAPPPEAIDDCYLTADASLCQQPVDKPSRVSWFVETLKLYGMLRKILATSYDNTGPGENDPGSHNEDGLLHMKNILDIDAQLQNFKNSLPVVLNWDTCVTDDASPAFHRERGLLKARFLYLKILLYRPLLLRTLREHKGLTEAESESVIRQGASTRFNVDCSVYGIQAAIDLCSLVHQTCNTHLSSVWFYNVFYSFTAGSVILLAELSPIIVKLVTEPALHQAWDNCQAALDYLSLYSDTAERCARTLTLIRSKLVSNDSESQDTSHHHAEDLHSYDQDRGESSVLDTDPLSFTQSTGGLFEDLDFNEGTLFDPFWLNILY